MKTLIHTLGNTLLLSMAALVLQTGSVLAEPVYSLRGTVGVDEL